MGATDTTPVLEVRDLSVRFQTNDGAVYAVNHVDFTLGRGQTLGIVGESGSGKSQTVLAMMGLLARNGTATGQVLHHGRNLLGLPAAELNAVRGDRIAMIFQDPMTSLNPYLTVERQMTEVLELHRGLARREARVRAIQALDATVQAQITQLLREVQRDHGTAIVMITHDLGVVAGLCDDVMVMYGGRVMEHASADAIFHRPSHPYTRGLLAALPRMDAGAGALVSIPGNPPNMNALPPGCPFSARCRYVEDRCVATMPLLQPLAPASPMLRACHRSVADLDAMEAADV